MINWEPVLFAYNKTVLSPMINDEVVLCVQTGTPKLAGDQWSRQFCLYNQELLTQINPPVISGEECSVCKRILKNSIGEVVLSFSRCADRELQVARWKRTELTFIAAVEETVGLILKFY